MNFVRQNQDGLPTSLVAQGPTFPYYQSAQFNSPTPLLQPGVRWMDPYSGSWFQYVKADVALTVGQLVTPPLPSTDTIVSASSTVAVLALNSGGLTAGAEVGNVVYIGTSPAVLRPIKANTASTLTVSLFNSILGNNQYDPDVLSAVPGNNTDVSIIRPNHVIVCTASLQPIGVALGTVTINYWTIIQIAGLAMVTTTGTGTATVVNKPAVTGAAGVAIGGSSTAFAYTEGVSMLPQYATAGTAVLTPMFVNFYGG